MPEYHVGCGLCGIYAGVLNKKGDDWKSKSDITNEATAAVAQFLLEQNKSMKFEYQGKKYRLSVCQAED